MAKIKHTANFMPVNSARREFPSCTIAGNTRIWEGARLYQADIREGAEIHDRASVQKGAVIGENATIEKGALIDRWCVVGAWCVIRPGAKLRKRCVIPSYAVIGSHRKNVTRCKVMHTGVLDITGYACTDGLIINIVGLCRTEDSARPIRKGCSVSDAAKLIEKELLDETETADAYAALTSLEAWYKERK